MSFHASHRGPRRRVSSVLLLLLAVAIALYAYSAVSKNNPLKALFGTTAAPPTPLLSTTETLIVAVGDARPLTGAPALALLNRQRTANGIPAITTLKQSYASAWCPNEDHGPGGGEIDRDLSGLTLWDVALSPWDNAPAHQFSLYDPAFTAAGLVDRGQQACLGLGAPAPQPAHPVFYAYTSDSGRDLVPPTEIVHDERPFAPQQYVGLPQGVATGPQLLLYAEGFPGEHLNVPGAAAAVHVLTYSLTSASGVRVSGVRFYDSRVAAKTSLSYSNNDGGVMILPPLAAATSYRVQVIWQGPTGVRAKQSFSFTTARSPGLKLTASSDVVIANTRSPQPLYFALARSPSRRAFKVATLGGSQTLDLQIHRSYIFCFYQPQGRGYTSARTCATLSYSGTTQPVVTVSRR